LCSSNNAQKPCVRVIAETTVSVSFVCFVIARCLLLLLLLLTVLRFVSHSVNCFSILFWNMAPTNKKRAASFPPRSDSKRPATGGKAGTAKGAKTPTKKPGPKPLSALGFSATKRQQFNVGTKLLLGTGIYDTPVPAQVKGHMFVYEIVEFLDNGKGVRVQYKDQVIKEGGDTFRVYKDSDDAQVSSYCYFDVYKNAILFVSHSFSCCCPLSQQAFDSQARTNQACCRILVSSERAFQRKEAESSLAS
jgi:hypothetical protein